jgi:hypoxanthine phosphoribosyltransferase
MEREVLTYEGFGQATRELAQRIADDGFRPDVVLSIARGGFFLGAGLGYALNVKNAFMMSVEFYTGVDERLAVPVVLPPVPNKVDFSGLNVLIADDVADSGETLKLVRDFIAGEVKAVRSAVLYEKPSSLIKPEYAWRMTERWIDFPWSCEGPVVGEGLAH